MGRLPLFVALLFLSACITWESGGSNPDAGKRVNFDYTPEKLQKALESGKPTMLQLASEACIFCVKMEPTMRELKKEYAGRVNILTADFNEEKELVSKYNAVGTPYFVFFDSEGRKVRTLIGYQSKENMKRMIDSLLPDLGVAITFDSSPTGELAIGGVEYANGRLIFNLYLRDDRYVRSRSLAAFLDGKPLRILESKPDLTSDSAPEEVMVFNINEIRVVAEAPQERGSLLEAQLTIVDEEGGCGEGLRDIFATYNLTRM